MTTDLDSAIFSEFLDDYFAECDEHLAHVRHILLELEMQGGAAEMDGESALSELLRRFHTIKGLSMMVGFAEAGELAHELESFLRKLHGRQAALTPEMIATLSDAVRLVEQTIACHKRGEKPSPATSFMKKLASLQQQTEIPAGARPVVTETHPTTPESRAPTGETLPPAAETCPAKAVSFPTEAKTTPAEAEPTAAGAEPSRNTLVLEFIPSRELAARGVNVQLVRETLEKHGRVLAVEPTVRPQGQVAFVFTVELEAESEVFEELHSLGVAVVKGKTGGTQVLAENPAAAKPTSPSPPARPPEPVPSLAPSTVVRVELGRLDELMNMCGELVLARTRLDSSLRVVRDRLDIQTWRVLQQHSELLERQIRTLRQAVMRVRMVPMVDLFERLRFAAHDLAREEGKRIHVVIEGGETEVDKLVVERILDPLLHLVRNAVTHGLETPEQRRLMGKPEQGTLRLRAAALGELLAVSVADDGAGLNLTEIRAQAIASGLVGPDGALDPELALEVISASGFSTRSSADLAGGRGVGMTIVRQTVEALGGEISLTSSPGSGTEFVLQIPLTLAIMEAVLVRVGSQVFAVPLLALREVIEIQNDRIVSFSGGEMVAYRGSVLPLLRLTDAFGLAPNRAPALYALVVGSESQPLGLVVDKVLEQKEIVVAPVSDPLLRVPGVAGATQMGDGSLVLILDPPRLARLAVRVERHQTSLSGPPDSAGR